MYNRRNIVRDYNKVQGITNVADLSYQIVRDINVREISVENSSPRNSVGVSITPFPTDQIPQILKVFKPGEIFSFAVNSQGSDPQYLWLLDPVTRQPVGDTVLIRSNSNQLVLRDGVNKWWVDFFYRTFHS